ncbi:hypothetical protein [Pseudomonas sp. P9_31]|uniref:hypothetical protein n=1 Tax=Pseudomonas sp. P9_31 TaxID=3043448 RepID=UPI002A361923|nr:hypothetical protein [Pseudomonas sp. P9_31]WPN59748.1 hypothetical protein QMK51_09140 [Pseudomonas sp. P9_31]
MATILEAINAGLAGLNTPLGQLGTQLLMASGPQAGNPGGGARMGQAFAGMQQQQAKQQQAAYQQAMAQNALALSQSRAQDAQRKQDLTQREQAALQNPELLAKLDPLSRQMAELGLPLDAVTKAQSMGGLQEHRAAMLQMQQQQQQRMAEQFQQQQAQSASQFAQSQARLAAEADRPKVAAPRQTLDEPLGGPDNLVQRHIFDAASGTYRPYGKPFKRSASTDELAALLGGGAAPDDNAGPGPAVPGLPGADATGAPPARQGAELLLHGSGSNPTARGPAAPKTKAEYDALPAGSQYIDPATGRVATKKGR